MSFLCRIKTKGKKYVKHKSHKTNMWDKWAIKVQTCRQILCFRKCKPLRCFIYQDLAKH